MLWNTENVVSAKLSKTIVLFGLINIAQLEFQFNHFWHTPTLNTLWNYPILWLQIIRNFHLCFCCKNSTCVKTCFRNLRWFFDSIAITTVVKWNAKRYVALINKQLEFYGNSNILLIKTADRLPFHLTSMNFRRSAVTHDDRAESEIK